MIVMACVAAYLVVGLFVSRAYYIHVQRIVRSGKKRVRNRWGDLGPATIRNYYGAGHPTVTLVTGLLVALWGFAVPIVGVYLATTQGYSKAILPAVKWFYTDPKHKELSSR